MRFVLAVLFAASAPAWAQTSTEQNLADAATFGAVATLAPMCGLRDEAWSADLRRAATTGATDDARLSAAVGYGDMEALEDFAADTPEVTCGSLRSNPALDKADKAVDTFRRRRDGKPVG